MFHNNSGDLFADLRALDSISQELSKHDRAIVLISACIGKGINTTLRIIDMLSDLGFDRKHLAIMLKTNIGSNSINGWWWRDGAGAYHLFD